MKYFISGYYGFRNLGDELILVKITDDINKIDKNAQIRVWSGNPDYTEHMQHVNTTDRFSLDDTVDAVKWADVVIVGGGGLIQEYYGLKIVDIFRKLGQGVASYSVVPLTARILQKPVFYWSHGVGPVLSGEGRTFAQWFYSLSDRITVRDQFSYDYLRSLNGDQDKIFLDVDPVMDLNLSAFIGKKFFHLPEDKIKIGINLRPWFKIDEKIKEIADACNVLYEEKKEIIFVPLPFDLSRDKKILREFADLLPDGSVFEYPFEEIERPEEVISVMADFDYFLGTRLHSIIISGKIAVPTLAISYDIKIESYCKLLKLPFLGLEKITKHTFLQALNDLLSAEKTITGQPEYTYRTPRLFEDFIRTTGFLLQS